MTPDERQALERIRDRVESIHRCGNRREHCCKICDGQLHAVLDDLKALTEAITRRPREEPKQ